MWWMFSASGFWWYMKDCYAQHDHHTAPHVHVPNAHATTHVAMAPALTETVNQCTTGSPPAQPVVVTHDPHATNIIINNNINKNNYHNSNSTNTVVVNSTATATTNNHNNNKKKSRVCCNNVAEDLRTIWGCLPPPRASVDKVDKVNSGKGGTVVVNHNSNNNKSGNDKQQVLNKTAEDRAKSSVKLEEKRTMNGGGEVVSSERKCPGKGKGEEEEEEEEEDKGKGGGQIVDMTCASSDAPKAEVVNAEDKRHNAAARRMEVERRLRVMRQRQGCMDRRSEWMLRRVFKLEALQAGHHVADQLARLVKHHWDNRMASAGVERVTVTGGSSGGGLLQNDGVKSMSTAALVNLVRKLESGLNDRTSASAAAFKQRLGLAGHPMNVQRQFLQQYPGNSWPSMSNPLGLQRLQQVKDNRGSSMSAETAAASATCSGFVADGKVSKDVSREMERTSSSLQAVVTTIQQSVDSDATESSSGGESCDEREDFVSGRVDEVTEKSKKMKQKPMNKRAAWKWAVDRGAVASRWTWLQAQVSELEYRVRQQNDFYRQLRLAKDPVILAEPAVRRTSADSSNKGNPSAVGPQPAGYRLQGNGYVVVCGASTSATEATSAAQMVSGESASVPDDDSTCTAVRTRPLRAFRKRKLVRPNVSALANRKNLKLSTLRCSCQFPDASCILCLGRYNRVQTLDPDAMSEEERVALLDSSFHPVLSFQEDKPLALFFGKQLRCDDWMKVVQKPKPGGVKKKGALKSGSKDPAHKHSRKLKKNATATLTAKLRKKLKGQKRNGRGRSLSSMRSSKRDHANERLHKKRAAKRMAIAMKKRRARSLSFSSGGSSKPGSPTPSVGQGENSSGSSQNYQTCQSEHGRRSSLLQDFMRRRRGENAFDINNIVIPYSMAAATRVERLQYKEILTPKWRMVDEVALSGQLKNNGLVQCVAQRDAAEEQEEESDKEDTSEEALIRRHDRCEHEEKKRFMSYVHPSWAGSRRTRAGLRSDSRADSSGANTPDPMSPHQMDQESPLTTPPSTPAPATPSSLIQEEFLAGGKLGTGGSVVGGGLIHSRRRTTSLSRGAVRDRDRERHQRERQLSEDARTSTPDIEVVPVQPWEPRKFPLTDEDFEAMQKASRDASLEAEERDLAERARTSSEDAAGQMQGGEDALTLVSSLDPDLEDSESRSAAGDDDPRDPEWTAPLISPCPATPRQLHHEGTGE